MMRSPPTRTDDLVRVGGLGIISPDLRLAHASVSRRFAKSAVLGFPQVEHLFKTARQDTISDVPRTQLAQDFADC